MKRRVKPVALPLEQILVRGDLQDLSLAEKFAYYTALCRSLKLNPLSRPFEYIWFEDHDDKIKLTLYAKKDCTDQLRKIHKVSVTKLESHYDGQYCSATAEVKDKSGRTDIATGVVFAGDSNRPQDLANCKMWAETKAKRRATLSICGLGMLDESELDTMKSYNFMTPGGRRIEELEPGQPGRAETREEVIARKTATMGRDPNTIYYYWFDDSQTARVDVGGLRDKVGDLLQRFWKPSKGEYILGTDQFDWFKDQLAERGIPLQRSGINQRGVTVGPL